MGKRIILIILMSFIIDSCSHSITKEIAQKAIVCRDSCVISIKELTEFKWDTLYAFEMPVSLEELNTIIGCNYQFYVEFTRPLIFFNEGKIIHYENNQSSPEGLIIGQILFSDVNDTIRYHVFTPKNAVFKIEKKMYEGNKYYQLNQIK